MENWSGMEVFFTLYHNLGQIRLLYPHHIKKVGEICVEIKGVSLSEVPMPDYPRLLPVSQLQFQAAQIDRRDSFRCSSDARFSPKACRILGIALSFEECLSERQRGLLGEGYYSLSLLAIWSVASAVAMSLVNSKILSSPVTMNTPHTCVLTPQSTRRR